MKDLGHDASKRRQKGVKSVATHAPNISDLVKQNKVIMGSERIVTHHQSTKENEVTVSKNATDKKSIPQWLQILAAVGIPLLLAYLALANLVNPQFAELRELAIDNRDAISESKVELETLSRGLESKTNLIVEMLIFAHTNEEVTEESLRNIMNSVGG